MSDGEKEKFEEHLLRCAFNVSHWPGWAQSIHGWKPRPRVFPLRLWAEERDRLRAELAKVDAVIAAHPEVLGGGL